MARTVAGRAELEEFLDTWWADSAVTLTRRSGLLKEIDRQIEGWLNSGLRVPGNLDANETQLGAIRAAVQEWRNSKSAPSRRDGSIDRLADLVDGALGEVAERRRGRAQQQALREKYAAIDPRLAKFARRTRQEGVEPATNRKHAALTADRDRHGCLTDRSLEMLDEIAQERLKTQLAIVGGVTLDSATPEQVQKIMAQNLNSVTRQTIYPELRSYLSAIGTAPLTADSGGGATGATERVAVGTTRLTVYWNPTDEQRQRRLAQLEAAIHKVQAVGYVVPALSAYFPKYGRNLIVSATEVTSPPGETKLSRAEYIPPAAVVASPEILDNPIDSKISGRYRHLSTEVAPDGPGTMVHELGHFLHYHQNQRKFHDLTDTELTSSAASSVSSYATNNPREFVAEVFLGLVYGKTFTAEIMEMYEVFGGPRSQAPRS